MTEETTAERAKRIKAARIHFARLTTMTDADREELLRLSFMDFPEVVTALPGFDGDGKFESLVIARRQFDMACEALVALLDEFHVFSGEPDFHRRSAREKFEELIDRIRKELFTFSTLAHSVQDHCRRVQGVWIATDFRERLIDSFDVDGLHDFVIALRNGLHHQRVFDAQWALRWSESGDRSSHINLKRNELLQEGGSWAKGRTWLENAPEEIDTRSLVAHYRAQAAKFYDWFLPWCRSNVPAPVVEYREIRRQHSASIARSHWSLALDMFVARGVDPMPYLPDYLTPDELARAMTLPAHSAELADFVISCVDEYRGCDEAIRQKAYKMFGVSLAP